MPFEFGKINKVKKAAIEAIEKYGLNTNSQCPLKVQLEQKLSNDYGYPYATTFSGGK